MDEFAPVKDEASRRHPEDEEDLNISDTDSNLSNDIDNLNLEDDEDFEIPGTGSNDMPIFKNSSKLTGSYQTVCPPPSLTYRHVLTLSRV